MTNLTLPEKVLLHVYRYRHIVETTEFMIPPEMTQNGISEAIGISRSHVSIIVGRLVDDGRLICRKGHVKGNDNSLRKVYFITARGCEHCRKMLDGTLRRDDIDTALPQNINYCCSSKLWSLPKEERDIVGGVLVLRCPVYRCDFDGTIPKLLPFDGGGRLNIKPETRDWFIRRADEDTMRSWHSIAADWCFDNGCDTRERLYHLYRSKRWHEATRLIQSNRYLFMDFPDKESRDIIHNLSEECEDCDLKLTAARMSLRLGDLSKAMDEAESVDVECPSRGAMISEILLAEGKNAMALDSALESYVGDTDTAAALGMCMTANGRFDEAMTYLRRWEGEMRRTGCSFRMDELLATISEALRGLGEPERADELLSIAPYWRKEPPAGYRSEDPVGPQVIDVRYVQIPDVLDIPFEHGEPLVSESPCQDGFLDTERRDDLGPEYPCSAQLHPLPVEEDLQLERGFGVREISGPDADLIESHTGVELPDHGDQHIEIAVLIDDDSLDLRELGQMGRIDGFVPEYAGDRERLPRCVRVLRDVLDAADRAVRPQQSHLGLLSGPFATPSGGTRLPAVLMYGLDHGDQLLVIYADG